MDTTLRIHYLLIAWAGSLSNQTLREKHLSLSEVQDLILIAYKNAVHSFFDMANPIFPLVDRPYGLSPESLLNMKGEAITGVSLWRKFGEMKSFILNNINPVWIRCTNLQTGEDDHSPNINLQHQNTFPTGLTLEEVYLEIRKHLWALKEEHALKKRPRRGLQPFNHDWFPKEWYVFVHCGFPAGNHAMMAFTGTPTTAAALTLPRRSLVDFQLALSTTLGIEHLPESNFQIGDDSGINIDDFPSSPDDNVSSDTITETNYNAFLSSSNAAQSLQNPAHQQQLFYPTDEERLTAASVEEDMGDLSDRIRHAMDSAITEAAQQQHQQQHHQHDHSQSLQFQINSQNKEDVFSANTSLMVPITTSSSQNIPTPSISSSTLSSSQPSAQQYNRIVAYPAPVSSIASQVESDKHLYAAPVPTHSSSGTAANNTSTSHSTAIAATNTTAIAAKVDISVAQTLISPQTQFFHPLVQFPSNDDMQHATSLLDSSSTAAPSPSTNTNRHMSTATSSTAVNKPSHGLVTDTQHHRPVAVSSVSSDQPAASVARVGKNQIVSLATTTNTTAAQPATRVVPKITRVSNNSSNSNNKLSSAAATSAIVATSSSFSAPHVAALSRTHSANSNASTEELSSLRKMLAENNALLRYDLEWKRLEKLLQRAVALGKPAEEVAQWQRLLDEHIETGLPPLAPAAAATAAEVTNNARPQIQQQSPPRVTTHVAASAATNSASCATSSTAVAPVAAVLRANISSSSSNTRCS